MACANVVGRSELDKELENWENLFPDRYTEKDEKYMKLKAKQLPPQPTCFPWLIQTKLLKRGWNWARSRDRNSRDWDRNRRPYSQHGDHRNERDRSQGDRYRDRNQGDRDHYRDRNQGDRDHYRDRSQSDRDHYRNRSYDDRDHYQDESNRMRR